MPALMLFNGTSSWGIGIYCFTHACIFYLVGRDAYIYQRSYCACVRVCVCVCVCVCSSETLSLRCSLICDKYEYDTICFNRTILHGQYHLRTKLNVLWSDCHIHEVKARIWTINCWSKCQRSYFFVYWVILYASWSSAVVCLFCLFFCAFFFKINFCENVFQENHQSVKQFGPRSGLRSLQASWTIFVF